MYKISGALLALFTLTACTFTPAQRPDYSKMPQDAFTKVFKQVRGNTSEPSHDSGVGRRLSTALVKGKSKEQIEALFRDNDGVCETLYTATLMNCSVTRLWTYSNARISPELGEGCEPGMQLLYRFYLSKPEQWSEATAPFDFKVLHLFSCPGAALTPSKG